MKKHLDIILRLCGWVFLLFIAIWLGNMVFSQRPAKTFPGNPYEYKDPLRCFEKPSTYPATWQKAGSVFGIALISFVDGMEQGWRADGRTSFERKFGADPDGFWGSNSDNLPEDGLEKMVGRFNFGHVADRVEKYGYLSGGVTLGIASWKSNGKWWHYALDFAATAVVSMAAKRAGYNWIRN